MASSDKVMAAPPAESRSFQSSVSFNARQRAAPSSARTPPRVPVSNTRISSRVATREAAAQRSVLSSRPPQPRSTSNGEFIEPARRPNNGIVRPTALMAMSTPDAHASNPRFNSVPRYARPHSLHGTSLTIPGCSPSHTSMDSPVLLPSHQSELSPTTGTFPLPVGFRSGGNISVSNNITLTRGLHDQARIARSSPLGAMHLASSTAAVGESQQVAAKPLSTEKHRSDDGFNWRKYGQKQVRGCERSYFKCTRPNCNAKKKVERTDTGEIVEKLCQEHNHPAPLGGGGGGGGGGGRRVSTGHDAGGGAEGEGDAEGGDARNKRGRKSASSQELAGAKRRLSDANGASDEDVDDDDDVPSSSPSDDMPETTIELVDELVSRRYSRGGRSSFGSDGGGNGSDEPTPNTKRRRLFPPASEMLSPEPLGAMEPEPEATPERNPAEPGGSGGAQGTHRLVVLTAAELETLDDGYRWRKYGQKLVKGNQNPRSYYKCTSAECMVRKHVERSSTDENAVIVTYEGSHDHAKPVLSAKQSKRASTGGAAAVPAADGDAAEASGAKTEKPSRRSSASADESRRTSGRVNMRAPVSLEVVVPVSHDGSGADYGPMSIIDTAKINKEADKALDSSLKTLDVEMPEQGPPTHRGLPRLQTHTDSPFGPGSLALPTPTPRNLPDPMGFLTTPKTPAVSTLKG